ncbi:DNA cytosine methyltransferase [Burkholderia multivorans]|uniref:DNA cytosine methyltransferase n=1 Tax=Burkholderia multivorans TaxID=87883 RepID=UPI002870531A|nr:DNA cytosine methyltransferase [Burkholderia multivorans]
MAAYYNEIDPYAAQWLRNLIAAGHIAPGDVDERSIEDVRPDDLRGYDQCHFFAGIGVWSHALRRAGWPDDRPVWTGSCPCQPFSAAGKGAGFDDERHLWPAWYWLIRECRPAVILGEQVASSAVDPWIDLVHADMEALDYPFGCVPFPSAGVGSPHIRDRAYWMAYADGRKCDGLAVVRGVELDRADAGRSQGSCEPESCGDVRGMADAASAGQQWGRSGETGNGCDKARVESERLRNVGERPGPTNCFWRDADWLLCRDGKWRPVEPGTFPLAHGAPARVGRLRAYGNAINSEAAVAWIEACRGVIG